MTWQKCFRMGITIDKWGPSAWNTLHSFAHRTPERLRPHEVEEWKNFLFLFAKRLPCPKCRIHMRVFLEKNINEKTFESRDNIVRLLHEAHNDVNRRTGKRTWTLEEHYRLYSRSPSADMDMSCESLVFVVILIVLVGISVAGVRKNSTRLHKCRRPVA